MTPKTLAGKIVEIIALECHCPTSWIEHPGPVTREELARIVAHASKLFVEVSEDIGDLCSICRRPVVNGKWHEHASE